MSRRAKLVGAGILLCLALGLTIVLTARTVHAVRQLQQSRHMALSGDVRTVAPWMTLPFISRAYDVPEPYLLATLHIADAQSVRHVTLYSLARRRHEPPATLVRQVQTAILTYRSQPPPTPTPATHSAANPPPLREASA